VVEAGRAHTEGIGAEVPGKFEMRKIGSGAWEQWVRRRAQACLDRREPFYEPHEALTHRTFPKPGRLVAVSLGGIAGDIGGGTGQQFKTTWQNRGALPMGEESEVSDAYKSARENMQKEPAQKLFHGQGGQPFLVLMSRVAPSECNFAVS